MGGKEKDREGGRKIGREENARRIKHGPGGRGPNEAGGDSAAAAGADGRSAKAVEGSALVTGCYRCGKGGRI